MSAQEIQDENIAIRRNDLDPLIATKVPENPNAQAIGTKATLSMALSGGGYRAALFQLGAIRRLHELNILNQIQVISSVSGGSILSAHLAKQFKSDPSLAQRKVMEETFFDFVRRDIRTLPALLSWAWLILGLLVLGLAIALHIEWWLVLLLLVPVFLAWLGRGVGARLLAGSYNSLNDGNLKDIVQNPKFIFCATDIIFGVSWTMTQKEIGDYKIGKAKTPEHFKVSTAVASSSCFPPVFFPTAMKPDNLNYVAGLYAHKPESERQKWAREMMLIDGGVYDNLGLEPVWKDTDTKVLVCDGGGPLPVVSQRFVVALIQRYSAIIQNQAIGLRKRMLIGKFANKEMGGTYWGLTSSVEKYAVNAAPDGPPAMSFEGYTTDFVNQWIAPIRTDLAFFTSEEVGILMNHGYTLAHAAVKRHCPELIQGEETPFQIPYPKLMDETKACTFLKKSHKLIVLCRFLKSFTFKKTYLAKLRSYASPLT